MDGGEETLVVKTDEVKGECFAGEDEFGATGEMLTAGVGAEVEVLVLWMGDQTESGAIGHDDGAEGEVVGTVGSDDEAMAIGGENGTATAERIGGGSGRSGHDKTVAGIGGYKVVVDKKVGAQECATLEKTVEADFVDDEGVNRIVGLVGNDMEKSSRLNGVTSGEEVGDQGGGVETTRGGEEPKVAEVDTDDWYLATSDEVDGAQECAVATNGKKKVEMAFGEGVGYFFGFDTVILQDVAELLVLLSICLFNITDV
jgi:hypothetical protein